MICACVGDGELPLHLEWRGRRAIGRGKRQPSHDGGEKEAERKTGEMQKGRGQRRDGSLVVLQSINLTHFR